MASANLEAEELDIFREVAKELVFLRFFYKQAGEYSGPASGDIYGLAKESYCGELPEGY